MSALLNWFVTRWNDLVAWIKEVWQSLSDFLTDLPISVLDGILSALASMINSISMPSFLQNGGLQTLLNGIDPAVLYFLKATGFVPAVAVLGVGITFRLTRKIVTLGQW